MSSTTEMLSGEYLRSVGFKGKRVETVQCYYIGKPHFRLYIFEGYSAGSWAAGYWACVGKYQPPDVAARSCAHFDKRLHTVTDLHQLVDAIGIKLKEPK